MHEQVITVLDTPLLGASSHEMVLSVFPPNPFILLLHENKRNCFKEPIQKERGSKYIRGRDVVIMSLLKPLSLL